MGDPAFINIDQVSKSFSSGHQTDEVLKDISFQVGKGEIVTLLGESGCGKSTLLNIIGGFEKTSSGNVMLDGQVVEKPSRRGIMLFQNYGLLPWRSVQRNVELGLENTPLSRQERENRVHHYLKLVGLEDKLHLFPHELSGGMQQRVAIARALVIQPELILMDEPFAALDTFNRYHLQDELLNIQETEKTTIILVTHDIDEAIYLSDRIVIMDNKPGRIKKKMEISLSRPRDRNHPDFHYFRKRIFDEFHLSKKVQTEEYTI